MNCPQCGTENRGVSNFCRFCGFNMGATGAKPDSGYIPSVPPPGATDFKEQYPPENYQVPPTPPVYNPPPHAMWRQLVCPRCASANVSPASTPVWAIVAGVLLIPVTCFVSLLLLLVKDPNRCLNCGNQFR